MELEYIREFCKLAEKENYTAAADELFISQSTLSRHIKAFETELGIDLFTRKGKNVEINEYGKRFLPYAKRILDVEKECMEKFFVELQKIKPSLTIGVFSLDKQCRPANLVFDFKEKFPQYNISLVEEHSDLLRRRLLDGDCEFALTLSAVQQDDMFESVTVYTDSLVALFPTAHPLAEAESISFAQLREETFLLQSDESAEVQLCCQAARGAGFEPTITQPRISTKGQMRLVEQGNGIAVKPKLFSQGRNRRLAAVEIQPVLNVYANVIYRRDVPLSAPGKNFIQFIKGAV